MQIKIEIPRIEDFNRVNELAKQVHMLHVKWRPDLFLDVETIISKNEFEEMIKSQKIFVAKSQEEIVGYIILKIQEKNSSGIRYRKQLSIEVICVDEKNRGNGIGTELLKYAQKFGRENNCTDLYLTVNEENKNAIIIYEKFGMKVKNIAYSMEI